MLFFIRRLFTLMLCLILLFGASLSRAEEEAAVSPDVESDELDQELSRIYRFGRDAEVETDENGEPVSVNGYPVRTVRAGAAAHGVLQFRSAPADPCQPSPVPDFRSASGAVRYAAA